jgi:gamma-glutamyl-gamma-aminobutyrate hydrolase PuuD
MVWLVDDGRIVSCSFWKRAKATMTETQDQWYHRQAIEQLAQHIPFERDAASKSEQIEMLRGLVIRHGRGIDPELFGFEARNELIRLGLWSRIGPEAEAPPNAP